MLLVAVHFNLEIHFRNSDKDDKRFNSPLSHHKYRHKALKLLKTCNLFNPLSILLLTTHLSFNPLCCYDYLSISLSLTVVKTQEAQTNSNNVTSNKDMVVFHSFVSEILRIIPFL